MSAKTCPGCGEVNHWPDGACSGRPASPLPEGRADGLEAECGVIFPHYPHEFYTRLHCDGHAPAPAVRVGVQPATEAATSATDSAVPTRPEPAEDPGRCPACGHAKHGDWCPNMASDNECSCAKAAVPVVHPEPGGRLRDAMREAGAAIEDMRPGTRFDAVRAAWTSLGLDDAGKAQAFVIGVMIHAHDMRTWDRDAEVAAAVAAVRADRDCLAGQVAAIRATAVAQHRQPACYECTFDLPCDFAALVASSPTTPATPEGNQP